MNALMLEDHTSKEMIAGVRLLGLAYDIVEYKVDVPSRILVEGSFNGKNGKKLSEETLPI